MKVRTGTRGRPLIALGVVLGGWIVLRAVVWNAGALPTAASLELPSLALADGPISLPAIFMETSVPGGSGQGQDGQGTVPVATAAAPEAAPVQFAAALPRGYRQALHWRGPDGLPPAGYRTYPSYASYWPASYVVPAWRPVNVPVRVAVGHQLLRAAMLSQMPLPLNLMAAAPSGDAVAPFYPPLHDTLQPRRWSADGWVLLRGGAEGTLASGFASATYGASQAGAVLRYRLAPESRHRLAAYLRTTGALNHSNEREVALGLSARPFASVPVIAAGELRATALAGGTRLRPAVMAITELPPFPLPRGTRGEAYLQAGYVGGRNGTAFADGQVRVDRQVATFGRAELRAGAGAWGGVQEGASRLDVGPAATMGMALGGSASAGSRLTGAFAWPETPSRIRALR